MDLKHTQSKIEKKFKTICSQILNLKNFADVNMHYYHAVEPR